jgi:threonine dehydratase
MRQPTFVDVLLAQRQIRPYLQVTPLHSYPAMTALLSTQAFIKED